MKKIILLIIVVFFLSGCNIRYSLNIDENLAHKETIEIEGKKSELGISSLKNHLDFYLKDRPFYEISSSNENDNTYKIVIKSNQGDTKVFQSSEAVTYLYNIQLVVGDNKASYYFYASDKYDQAKFDLENNPITFQLSSKLPVLESNADKVTDDAYTWYLTKDLKEIKFVLDIKGMKTDEEEPTILKKIDSSYIYISLGVIFFFLFIFIIIKHKRGGQI